MTNLPEDVMLQKIQEYKAMVRDKKPEVNVSFLMNVLDIVHDESEVKFAVNPLDENGNWIHGTTVTGVSSVRLLDNGGLAIGLAGGKRGMKTEDMHRQISKLQKSGCSGTASIFVFMRNEPVKITEVYAHGLRSEKVVGLPIDVVLAVKSSLEAN